MHFIHMKRFLFQRVLMINTSYKIVLKDSLISIFQHLVNAKWKWVCLKTLSFERLVYSKSAFEDIDKKGYDIHVLFFCIMYKLLAFNDAIFCTYSFIYEILIMCLFWPAKYGCFCITLCVSSILTLKQVTRIY